MTDPYRELMVNPPRSTSERIMTAIPERRLMFAILLDAITHLQRRGSAGADEAKRWIRSDSSGPCSFRSTCEAVGIAPSYLARRLLSWHAGNERELLGSPNRLLRNGRPRVVLRRRPVRRRAGAVPPSSALPAPLSAGVLLASHAREEESAPPATCALTRGGSRAGSTTHV